MAVRHSLSTSSAETFCRRSFPGGVCVLREGEAGAQTPVRSALVCREDLANL